MRTTLDIDDDVLTAAKDLARAEGRTTGEVISDLARRALTTPAHVLPSGMSEAPATFAHDDFPLLPVRGEGGIVTNDLVRQLQDEIDLEDSIVWDHARNAPRAIEPAKAPKRKA